MKSHNRRVPRQLQLEKFLTAVANIRQFDQMEDAFRQYRQFLPPALTTATAKDVALREFQSEEFFGPELTPITLNKERLIYAVGTISARLRRIWTEKDPQRREWYIYRTRDFYHRLVDPDHPDDVPAPSPFQRAMMHLAQNADRMGHCINPDCPAPFFLSKDSRLRTFCSPDCAGPAKRLAKLKWWRKKKARTK